MAMKLIDMWTNELAIQNAALAAAQAEMAADQASVAGAKKKLGDDTKALKDLLDKIAANRKALTTASVPSEVAQLNATIRDQLIEQRGLQGTLLDDQEKAALAAQELGASTKAVKLAQDSVKSAQASVDEAKKAEKQRKTIKDALNDPPLKTLKAGATAFSTSAVATDAKTVITGNIPNELQALVIERRATRVTRDVTYKDSLNAAELAYADALGAVSGVGATVAKKKIAFDQANARLNEYVAMSAASYDNIVAMFKKLQKIKLDPAKNPDILSPAQKNDAGSTAARVTAAQKATDVDGKLEAVIDAEKDLDAGVLSSIDTDVDAFPADPAVTALQGALTTAEQAYDTDRTAITTNGERKVLNEWEIVVPDAVWQRYVDYVEATIQLNQLKSTDPAALVADLDAAEDEYAVALAKEAKARRRIDALSRVVDMRSKRAEMSRSALPERVLSAARGDTY